MNTTLYPQKSNTPPNDYGSRWLEMEDRGCAILHGDAEPPRDLILTRIQNFPGEYTRVEFKDSPLYYIQPCWGTILFQLTEEYVQYGINYRAHCHLNLDGLDPPGQVRIVGCRKIESTADTSTNYMLGPQDYRTGDAMALIRPIAEEINFRPFDGSHLLIKSEFDRSDPKPTLLAVRRQAALEIRTTTWLKWSNSSTVDTILFATIVYANNPARPPRENEDFPGCVNEASVAPFMQY